MLRPRIIPCLLIRNGGLVKTTRFGDAKYVGDPINAVRIFNEKQVDELIVLDIDATAQSREPDYALIRSLAAECRMPLCYGGGIRSVEQVERVVSLGVEKVALSAAAAEHPDLIRAAADRVGRQSVVVVVDVRKSRWTRTYEVFTHNGTRKQDLALDAWLTRAQLLGAGEIVVNAIDRDGEMKGYDMELIERARRAVTVPLTALGGAGSLDHIADLVRRFGIIGAAAGSLFVFKGRYRAVLISYPRLAERDALIAEAATTS